jgi:hypothetical protein
MRRLLLLALAVPLGVVAAPSRIASSATPAAYPTPPGPGWTVICGYDHSLKDDPIVSPSQPGASHQHDFFGSHDTNAYSTPQSLRQSSGTSCGFQVDRSGYWFPSLIIDGEPLAPYRVSMYYRGPDWEYDSSAVQPIPAGLRMIAGDAKAAGPQPAPVTHWQCGPATDAPKTSVPSDCTPYPGSSVRANLTFPSCWDGVHVDSADHKSHMAYPVTKGTNDCPSTHPVLVVRLTAVVTYPVVDGSTATLSSGLGWTFHGDVMNGWDQTALTYLVRGCVRASTYCKFSRWD